MVGSHFKYKRVGIFSGLTASEIGGALWVGIMLSGILIMVLGALGIGNILKRLFTPVVMSTVLFLLAAQLVGISQKECLDCRQEIE